MSKTFDDSARVLDELRGWVDGPRGIQKILDEAVIHLDQARAETEHFKESSALKLILAQCRDEVCNARSGSLNDYLRAFSELMKRIESM